MVDKNDFYWCGNGCNWCGPLTISAVTCLNATATSLQIVCTFKNISYFILLGNCHAILLFHCVKYKCRGNWNCWIDTLNEVLSSTINLVKNGCHADMFVYLKSLLFIRGKGNAAADLTAYDIWGLPV